MQHLLECIQKDATSSIKRWSMRELASQAVRFHPSAHPMNTGSTGSTSDRDDTTGSRNVSSELLRCTVQRLAVQHESLRAWKQALTDACARLPSNAISVAVLPASTSTTTRTSTNQMKNHLLPLYKSVIQRLDTLQYIHFDTYRIGQQILQHPSHILQRQTVPDQHVIHTTFLEIRARHAKTTTQFHGRHPQGRDWRFRRQRVLRAVGQSERAHLVRQRRATSG